MLQKQGKPAYWKNCADLIAAYTKCVADAAAPKEESS